MPSPQFTGVTLDTHVYTVFTNENIVLDRVDRIKAICNMQGYLSSSQSNLWTFVGGTSISSPPLDSTLKGGTEWSTAPTDCAGSLNG
jgi:glucan 1,3-beta-glucosidase